MKKFIKSISIVMSFLMIFLLVDSSLVNAENISDSFGYQGIVITRLDDGSREMEVCFDNDEIGNIKEIKVQLNLTNYVDGSEVTKQYKTYSLTEKSGGAFKTTIQKQDMRVIGSYDVNKIEVIKYDRSRKVIFNKKFNSSTEVDDFTNNLYLDIQPVYEEKYALQLENIELRDKKVKPNGTQIATLNLSSSDKQVLVKSVYTIFEKDSATEINRKVVPATLNSDGKYEAKMVISNKSDAGIWKVSGYILNDNFGRSIEEVVVNEDLKFEVLSSDNDVSAPVLEEVFMVNGNIYDGISESAVRPQINIKATDDIAGVRSVAVNFVKDNDSKVTRYVSTSNVNEDGYYVIYVPTDFEDGSYVVQAIETEDKVKNKKKYINKVLENSDLDSSENYEFKDLSTLNIEVINNNKVPEPEAKIEIISVNKNFKNTASLEELSFSITYKYPKQLDDFSLNFTGDNVRRIMLKSREIIDNGDGTYTVNISSKNSIGTSDTFKYSLSGKYKLTYGEFNVRFGGSILVHNSAYDSTDDYNYENKYDFSDFDFELENPNEDRTPPRVTEIKLDKQIVTAGETVKLTLKIEDDNSGVMMGYCGYPFNPYSITFNKVVGENDIYEAEIEIPNNISIGIYEINQFHMRDVAGNAIWFFNNIHELNELLSNATILVKSDLTEKMPPTIRSNIYDGSTFVNKVQPTITTDHGILEMELDGKKYDGSEIKSAGTHTLYIKATGVDGSITTAKFTFEVVEKLVVEMNEDTKVEEVIDQIVNSSKQNIQVTVNTEEKIVSKEIFEAIKGTDKSVTFVQADRTEWSFSGKDIKDGANINDIKLSVKFITEDKYAELAIEDAAEDALIIHFDYHGKLPGKAAVKIFVGHRQDLIGKDLTFYYYNAETKKIEEVQGPVVIDNNGFVTVEITHCSDYFLSSKDNILTDGENSDITEPGDSDVTEPGDSDITEPGDSDVTEPGDSDVTEPGDSDVAEPGDNNVTVPDKETVKPDDSADRIEPGKGLEKNDHGNNEDTKTGDVGNSTRIVVFILGLSALVLLGSYKKKKSSIII